MAIVLDGLTLNGSLQWQERDGWQPVGQATRRTLGGNLVVYHQAIEAGMPITLEATEETGWIKRSVLTQLVQKASVPGAVYAFEYHGATYDVVFRHNEPPALEFRPLIPRATPLPDDYYIGTLKLLTV